MKIAAIVVNQKLYLWLAGTAPISSAAALKSPGSLSRSNLELYTALFNKSLTETQKGQRQTLVPKR